MSTKTKDPSDLESLGLLEELLCDTPNDTSVDADMPAKTRRTRDIHHSSTLPTRNQMIGDEVEALLNDEEYMERILKSDVYSPQKSITSRAVRNISLRIVEHNTDFDTGKRLRPELCWKALDVLPPFAIARLVMRFHHIRYIVTDENLHRGRRARDTGRLAIFNERNGLYSVNLDDIGDAIRAFNEDITKPDMDRALGLLAATAPRVVEESCRRFVAVKNGVFDLETKTLNAFTPEHVFLSKIDIAISETEPEMPVFEDGRTALTLLTAPWPDDCRGPHFSGLLWQILRSVVTTSIGKAIHLYGAPKTGKSCFIELCSALVGPDCTCTLSLADVSMQFGMSGISGAKLLIDADMGGRKMLEAGNVKKLITGDAVVVEDKYEPRYSYRNRALWIMAGNSGSMSSFDDKSTGVSDRFIHVPFNQKMSETRDSSVLEFLTSAPCLEWVLWHVLYDVPDFKTYDYPPSVQQADAEINSEMGIMPNFLMWITDTPEYMVQMAKAMFVPRDWLYDKYLLYTQEVTSHSKTVMGLTSFMRALEPYLDPSQWQNVGDYQCTIPSRFWQLESEQRTHYSAARVDFFGFAEGYYLCGRHRGLLRVADSNATFSQDDVTIRFDDDPTRENSLLDCMTISGFDGFFSTLYRDDVRVDIDTKIDLSDAFLHRLLFPLGERSYQQKTRHIYVNGVLYEFTLERPQ